MRAQEQHRRAAIAAIAGALVAVLVTAGLPASGPAHDGSGAGTYLVRSEQGAIAAVTRAVREGGGSVTTVLASLDTAVAELDGAQVADVAGHPGVVAVTPDSGLQLASSTYDAKADVDSLYSIATVVGARDTWGRYTGRGVDIAVIDSGVAQVPGLQGAGKIVRGPDLSFESQDPGLRHQDTFGHGTHMAGIMAGRDKGADVARTVAGDGTAYLGIAPDARIVSVKVADAYGATDVSQVLAAIDWVVQHARSDGLAIRIVNMSFGTRPLQPYQIDPLAHAAEVAWRNGIVVVASAGNDGTGTGSLSSPGYNPNLLAVGAVESNGTRDTADDVIPSWSSRGTGVRNPDLVAPGSHVQGLRVPGSYIDSHHGAGPGSINERFLRGSGTSQAAAVVSGAVALLLEQRPTLTPDQVKALLRASARQLPVADPQASGSGLLNIKKALQTVTPSVSATAAPSRGTGSLDAARGGTALRRGAGLPLTGERDIFGKHYDAATQSVAATTLTSWSGGTWNGSAWTGVTWDGVTWDGVTWDGVTWDGVTWDGVTWDGLTWDGLTWDAAGWTSGTWTGVTWDGASWAASSWGSGPWAGSTWDSHTWATAAWR